MRRLSTFARDESGATAVEFALISPVLIAFIMLLVEGGRMEWTQQTLQEVSFNSARCMALGTTACNSTSAIQTYAQGLARGRGVSLTGATITVAPNQTCNSVTGMNQVTIDLPYRVASGLLPGGPTSLRATSCFPSVT